MSGLISIDFYVFTLPVPLITRALGVALLEMYPSDGCRDYEQLFDEAHKDFIDTLEGIIYTLQHDGFTMENCWEVCDQLDLLDSLLGDMEELGPEMALETPRRLIPHGLPRHYFLGHEFHLDCLGIQAGLDDVRGILAECFYDDCAEVACIGLESLLSRLPF
uniref:Uncharacterized protein n=1 Tax=Penicillium aethiopicum TaxID=36650 RepID=F1CWF2_PENAE|nr:hypothetical protein [Penicillium aethiopicum]